MSRAERARQLRWLMILRVVTITTLLISAFAIELLLIPADMLRPLFLLAAVAYGTVLLYAVLDRWLGGTRTFIYLQLVGDALVLTAFVGITGGLDSAMSFLYLLPIAVASLMLYREGGLVLAAVCWTLYAALVTIAPAWLNSGSSIRLWIERDPGRVVYSLVVHLVGMVAVALLSSYLSERLKRQGDELIERRGAVARLQALNENIIESINSGLVTTDLDGRIHFINRGGCEITGLAQDAVAGQRVEWLFGVGGDELDDIRRQLSANRRFRFERYFDTPRGRRIYLGIAASNLFDRESRSLGYIFVFQDLTEIHELENEVRLHERMAALGEMAAGMAHELRNPLASISGAVQYLKGEIRPTGESLELMDIILRESNRLDQAIRDFLTFARPGPFNAVRCDLVRLLQDHIKLLTKSQEYGTKHRVETDFAEPAIWCEVDQNRMKQVFWNLATNAVKAMPEGGRLHIRVAPAGVTGDAVLVTFSDEGTGMTDEELQQYFQPFSGSFGEGSGLGAAIVYRLVEEHGGRISVDSAKGRGTRIHIELPSRQAAGSRPEPAPAILAAAEGRRS